MKLHSKDIFAPVNVILIVLNLIALNLVTMELFARVDLTENKVYTLSKVTKGIIRDLKEPLTVKAYFTKDLPSPYNNIARTVEDQLAEMKAYGKGNFRYEFLDPGSEEDLKKEADKFRIEPMQVQEMRSDKMELKLAYMGMVLIYEDKQEVIPAIQSLENLEYEIVSKIKRVTTAKAQTLGFVEGHDEPTLREDMTTLDRELRKNYDIKQVDLSVRSTIPEDIDLLCVIGPKKDLPEKDRFAIDQFLMRGGKLLFCANNVAVDLQNLRADRGALRIDSWTENYGFKLGNELVVDRMAPTLPFQMATRYGRQITYVVYPLFPEIVTFNRDNGALKALRQVRFYFPTAIDTSAAAGMAGIKLTPLFWTSDKSGTMGAPFDINPLNLRGKVVFDRKNIPLGALVQGKFTSFWKDKKAPVDDDGNAVSEDPIIPESPDTRIVVYSDANFIQDQYLVPGLDNLILALNTIDWMSQDEALISIRSKEVGSRPIKADVADATRRTVKYANMIIPPLLIIGFGVVRWRVRQSARRMALKDITVIKSGGSN